MQNLLEEKILEEAIDQLISETQASLFPLLLAKTHKTESSNFKFMTRTAQSIACDAVKDAFKETGFTVSQKIADVKQDYAPNILGEPSDDVGKYEEFASDIGSTFGISPMYTRSNDVYEFTKFTKMILDYYNKQISSISKISADDSNSSDLESIDDLKMSVFSASVFHVAHVVCALHYSDKIYSKDIVSDDEQDIDTFYPGGSEDDSLNELHIDVANNIRDYLDRMVESKDIYKSVNNALKAIGLMTYYFDLKFDDSYINLLNNLDDSLVFSNGNKSKINAMSLPGNLHVYLTRGLSSIMSMLPILAAKSIKDVVKPIIKYAGGLVSIFFAFIAGIDIGYSGQMAFRGSNLQIQMFLDSLCAIFLREIVGAQSEDILESAWKRLSSTGNEEDFIEFLTKIDENASTKDEAMKNLDVFLNEIVEEVKIVANNRFENNLKSGVFADVISPQLQSSFDRLLGQSNMPGSETIADPLSVMGYFAIGAFEKVFSQMPKQSSTSAEAVEKSIEKFLDSSESHMVYLDPREYKALFQDRYENLTGDTSEDINAIILDINKLKNFNRFGDSFSLYIIKKMIDTFLDSIREEIEKLFIRIILSDDKKDKPKEKKSMKDLLDSLP